MEYKYPIESIRDSFPLLSRSFNGREIVYLDSAATAQKPKQVIDSIVDCYENYNSNIGRGNAHLSGICTQKYEEARDKVRDFISAKESAEVIFTSGTTVGINIIALAIGRKLQPTSNVVVSGNEHNSNYWAWRRACKDTGASLRVIPTTDTGELDYEQMAEMVDEHTMILSVTAASNVTGIRTDLEFARVCCRNAGCIFMVDLAQCCPHKVTDVMHDGIDIAVFSGHKIYADTGIGVLYGKRHILEWLEPCIVGSGMIETGNGKLSELPKMYEAGTPHYVGAISLGAAIDYINNIGLDSIMEHEQGLLEYLTLELQNIDGVKILGLTQVAKCPLISFVVDDCNSYDVSELLSAQGVMVRAGKLCSESVLRDFKEESVCRISLGLYNNRDDCDKFISALQKSIDMLNKKRDS